MSCKLSQSHKQEEENVVDNLSNSTYIIFHGDLAQHLTSRPRLLSKVPGTIFLKILIVNTVVNITNFLTCVRPPICSEVFLRLSICQ